MSTNAKSSKGQEKPEPALFMYWNQKEEEITIEVKQKRFKALRREAEIAVANHESDADKAKYNLEDAIRRSLTSDVNINDIFELSRKYKIAKAKHEDAVSNYIDLFGESPKLQ